MTLDAIKEAIERLPQPEKSALLDWLHERDQRDWAAQIEADFSPGGAGMALLREVDQQIEQGRLEEFKVTRPRERSAVNVSPPSFWSTAPIAERKRDTRDQLISQD